MDCRVCRVENLEKERACCVLGLVSLGIGEVALKYTTQDLMAKCFRRTEV